MADKEKNEKTSEERKNSPKDDVILGDIEDFIFSTEEIKRCSER